MTRFPVARRRRSFQILAVAVLLGGVMTAAELAAGLSVVQSLSSWAIIVGYGLFVTLLQGRSETISTLAGQRVDERWDAINLRALAFTAEIGVAVAIPGFIAAEFRRVDSTPFALVAATMGIAYIAGIVLYRSRS